jgi:hypothetical protein
MNPFRILDERLLALRVLASLGALLSVVSVTGNARADIKTPGAHIDYSFELEPEVILVLDRPIADGPGAGVRGSIPVLFNGFIPKLNNSVAITFGFDKDPLFKGTSYYVPIALQWNFWLSEKFSIFGEPGLLFASNQKVRIHPEIWGGARLHLSDTVALTARASVPSVPAVSFGVSLFF